MGVGSGLRVAELDSVEGKAERCLDTGSQSLGVAKAEDTGVVDLGLHKGSVVKVGLGTNLKVDVRVGALGVVGGTSTGLGVSIDAVVVAGRVGREVAETVEGDGVVGGVEASTEVVSAQFTLLDVVRSLGTGKETIAAKDGVSSEGGTLEEVEVLTGVQTGLLVGGSEKSVLGLLLGDKGGDELELEALGDVVLELNVVAEDIGSGPSLGEGDAVLAVLPLGLEVAVDGLRLGVTDAENAEGDTVGGLGLDLERVTVNGVVLREEIAGGLAKVLPGRGNGLGNDGSHCAGGRKEKGAAEGVEAGRSTLSVWILITLNQALLLCLQVLLIERRNATAMECAEKMLGI